MQIFIGSSTEALKKGVVDKVTQWIEEQGHKPLAWNSNGLFPPGSYTLPRLIEISRDVGAAIFIFSEDDKTWYRGDERTEPRDNVALEYGIFAGYLNERRVIVVRHGQPSHPSDINGITYISLNSGDYKAKNELSLWISQIQESIKTVGTKNIQCYTQKYAMNNSN
jgi:predicted nucleotide-binding protein